MLLCERSISSSWAQLERATIGDRIWLPLAYSVLSEARSPQLRQCAHDSQQQSATVSSALHGRKRGTGVPPHLSGMEP